MLLVPRNDPMPRTATVTIHVPAPLRHVCGGASEIALSAGDVRGALSELGKQHPELYRSACDETGSVRRHVNVFVNAAHVRDLDGLDTRLEPGDVVSILPAVSGG